MSSWSASTPGVPDQNISICIKKICCHVWWPYISTFQLMCNDWIQCKQRIRTSCIYVFTTGSRFYMLVRCSIQSSWYWLPFRSTSSYITTINQQYLLPLLVMQQMLQDTSNGIDFTFIIASEICPLDTSLTLRKIFVGSFMPDIMD